MQSIRRERYGSPAALTFGDAPKPVPQDDEVLVKVYAAAANPLDWHKLRATPVFVRLSDGLFKPKHPVLGADIAGRVEAVGRKVTQFKAGDDVFGDVESGGFAEYVCGTEKQLAHKPPGISFEEAAAAPVAALTALQGLRDYGQLQAGQKVLVNGASGGVGTFAVQLAKVFGADVTGVCSTRNLELVQSLGADSVIDYTQHDYTRLGQRYDLILDAVGNGTAGSYGRALTPEGRAVVAGFTTLSRMLVQVMLLGFIVSRASRRTVTQVMATVKQADLVYLAALLEQGKLKSVIDRRYPLADTPQAIAYLETGRARGKVVVQIAESQVRLQPESVVT